MPAFCMCLQEQDMLDLPLRFLVLNEASAAITLQLVLPCCIASLNMLLYAKVFCILSVCS